MSDRYLVTGGAGFIGSHIVRRLISEGVSVRVVDNLSTGTMERLIGLTESLEFIEGDLADQDTCERAVRDADYVLHQAAIPSVQRSVLDPTSSHRANVTATLNLLDSSRKAGIRRFVYAASSSVYGDTAVLPKTESMCPDPLSPYALQKFVGERYCKLFYDLYGLETVSLRYFNVFGPGQDPHSQYSAVIPKFIKLMLAREEITVYGDGEQSRDFTYVDNVVDANLCALRSDKAPGSVCNIGCGERITLNSLIRHLEEILGVSAVVAYFDKKPGDVLHSLADISTAGRLLGYEPKVLVRNGLKETVAAYVTALTRALPNNL